MTLPPSLSDRKSTRLNSSHSQISYAVFCLKKTQQTVLLVNAPPELLRPPHLALTSDVQTRLASIEHFLAVSPAVNQGCALCVFFLIQGAPPKSTLFPPPTPFRS